MIESLIIGWIAVLAVVFLLSKMSVAHHKSNKHWSSIQLELDDIFKQHHDYLVYRANARDSITNIDKFFLKDNDETR